MSSLGKIKKNVDKYRMEEFCRQMTPEQYRQALKTAVKNATESLAIEYDKRLQKMQEEYELQSHMQFKAVKDTISVELLYELGRQLGCFEENPEFLEQKIDTVQNIFEKTMEAISKYAKYKNGNQSRKEFLKKQKKVENMFNIKF